MIIKKTIWIALLLAISLSTSYFIAHQRGYSLAVQEYQSKFQEELKVKLQEQKKKIEKDFEILMNAEKKKKEIEKIYIDREVIVKEIVHSENMSCKLTQEQVKNLNDLTK